MFRTRPSCSAGRRTAISCSTGRCEEDSQISLLPQVLLDVCAPLRDGLATGGPKRTARLAFANVGFHARDPLPRSDLLSGLVVGHERWPSLSFIRPPSPRQPCHQDAGREMPVGWNCTPPFCPAGNAGLERDRGADALADDGVVRHESRGAAWAMTSPGDIGAQPPVTRLRTPRRSRSASWIRAMASIFRPGIARRSRGALPAYRMVSGAVLHVAVRHFVVPPKSRCGQAVGLVALVQRDLSPFIIALPSPRWTRLHGTPTHQSRPRLLPCRRQRTTWSAPQSLPAHGVSNCTLRCRPAPDHVGGDPASALRRSRVRVWAHQRRNRFVTAPLAPISTRSPPGRADHEHVRVLIFTSASRRTAPRVVQGRVHLPAFGACSSSFT